MLNEDYRDMLRALSDEKVKFLLVGAYALAAHGYPRATVDIDVWVLPSPENADAVLRALRRFGSPIQNLTREDLQTDDIVFQIGIAPRRIDIITTASGLQFEEAFGRSMIVDIDGMKSASLPFRTSSITSARRDEPRTSLTQKPWKSSRTPNNGLNEAGETPQ